MARRWKHAERLTGLSYCGGQSCHRKGVRARRWHNTIAFLPISAVKVFEKLPKAAYFVSQSRAHAQRTPSPYRRGPHLPARRLGEGRDRPGAADGFDGRVERRHAASQSRVAPDRAVFRHQCLAIGGGPEFQATGATTLAHARRRHGRPARGNGIADGNPCGASGRRARASADALRRAGSHLRALLCSPGGRMVAGAFDRRADRPRRRRDRRVRHPRRALCSARSIWTRRT